MLIMMFEASAVQEFLTAVCDTMPGYGLDDPLERMDVQDEASKVFSQLLSRDMTSSVDYVGWDHTGIPYDNPINSIYDDAFLIGAFRRMITAFEDAMVKAFGVKVLELNPTSISFIDYEGRNFVCFE